MRLTFGKTRPIIVKLLTALDTVDSVYKLDSVLMEKEGMTDVKLLVDILKASFGHGRPADLANWPSHGAEIDRACMQYAF